MYARRSIAAAAAALALAGLTQAAAAPNSVESGVFAGCPAEGSGGDPQLNKLKNRSTAPSTVNPITVGAMKQLPILPADTPSSRANWPASARAAVGPHEGQGVVLTGYIINVTHETGDPSNCGSNKPRQEDVELFLAEHSAAGAGRQMILAEVTPRWRAANPSWRTANLRDVADAATRVRVTGWLLYDQESWNETRGRTVTPWEIEPITQIQVWKNGSWAND